MESTCKKGDCYWWKKMGERCPLFLKGEWTNDEGISKLVEDCAPVRNTLQLRVIHNLLIGLQKASNQERNSSDGLVDVMMQMIQKASQGRILINGLDTEKAALPTP